MVTLVHPQAFSEPTVRAYRLLIKDISRTLIGHHMSNEFSQLVAETAYPKVLLLASMAVGSFKVMTTPHVGKYLHP